MHLHGDDQCEELELARRQGVLDEAETSANQQNGREQQHAARAAPSEWKKYAMHADNCRM